MSAMLLPKLRKLGPVGLLGILWAAIPSLLGLYMVARLGTIAELLQQHYDVAGAAGWTALMALCIGLGLLPVYSNTLLCGWVYGWLLGCALAMTSYFLAAILGFHLARGVSLERVNALIEAHDGARRVRRALVFEDRKKTLLIVSLWRLSGSPFPLTNLAMASCGVPFGTYLLGTLCGLTPRIFIGTLMAATVARTGARDIQALVTESQHPALWALGLVASLIVLGIIGHIARRALHHVTAERPTDDATEQPSAR